VVPQNQGGEKSGCGKVRIVIKRALRLVVQADGSASQINKNTKRKYSAATC
jgi:hypothetical protein